MDLGDVALVSKFPSFSIFRRRRPKPPSNYMTYSYRHARQQSIPLQTINRTQPRPPAQIPDFNSQPLLSRPRPSDPRPAPPSSSGGMPDVIDGTMERRSNDVTLDRSRSSTSPEEAIYENPGPALGESTARVTSPGFEHYQNAFTMPATGSKPEHTGTSGYRHLQRVKADMTMPPGGVRGGDVQIEASDVTPKGMTWSEAAATEESLYSDSVKYYVPQ